MRELGMKRILLVGSCVTALSSPAWAVLPVTEDGPLLGFTTQGWLRQGMDMVRQLQQMQQQYQVLMSQYQAIAHLPQNIAGMASGLTTSPTLQNPFPQSYALTGIMNGSALGPVSGLANQFRQSNTYYEPQGDDQGAVEMRARAGGLSGIQAMATNAMHSLEQRASSLGEFLGGIGESPDIQQTEAIQARLQLEQNYAAVQQAQATNLKVLADTQWQVNQQRDNEIARKDAEDWQAHARAAGGQ